MSVAIFGRMRKAVRMKRTKGLFYAISKANINIQMSVGSGSGSGSGSKPGSNGFEPKIGIVGGGASAIYTAHELLYRHGISNITIFEKGSTAASLSRVCDKSKKQHLDFGAMYLPASNFKIKNKSISKDSPYWDIDFDIGEPMKELISKYNLKLMKQNGGHILDVTNPASKKRRLISNMFKYSGWDISILKSIYNPIVRMNREKLRLELIYLLNLLQPLYELEYYTIDDIYNLNLCNKGETMDEWGKRNNCPMLSWFLMAGADMAGMTPAHSSSAASVLRLTEKYGMPHFLKLLSYLGIHKKSKIIKDYPFIQSLLHHNIKDKNGKRSMFSLYRLLDRIPIFNVLFSPSYYTYKTGYQSFWNSMVGDITSSSKGNIEIKFDTTVTSIKQKKTDGLLSVLLTTNEEVTQEKKNEYEFDWVFISPGRDGTLNLLDNKEYPDEHELYNKTLTAIGNNGIGKPIDYYAGLYKLRKRNQWFSKKDGIYPVFPYGKYAGTSDVNKIYQCQPFYINIFKNGKYLAAFGLADDKMKTIEECRKSNWDALTSYYGLGVADLKKEDLIIDYKWNFGQQFLPHSENDDCYDTLYNLQGKNGLIFIGETVSGSTVSNQMDFVKKFAPIWVHKMRKPNKIRVALLEQKRKKKKRKSKRRGFVERVTN